MKEIFLIYLWENKLIDPNLITVDGQPLEVIKPGLRNNDAGPDFLNAHIRIGSTLWVGNVEVHINSSDWYRHHHHCDIVYDTVILHVVFSADKTIYTTKQQKIPTLELKGNFDENILLQYRSFIDNRNWIACEGMAGGIQRFTWLSWLDSMVVERLQMKVEELLILFEQTSNDWEEVFYQRLMINFGFKVNDIPFEWLGRNLSFHLLLRHANSLHQIEALLFGMAGLLSNDFVDVYPNKLKKEYDFLKAKYNLPTTNALQWRFMRMRPPNFPTIRISQFAALVFKSGRIFSKILEAETVDQIKDLFAVNASEYWDNHFQFDKLSKGNKKNLGNEAVKLLLINTVTQVLFAYGIYHNDEKYKDKALMLLEVLEAENNEVIRKFDGIGVTASNALQSQALLHLKKQYCNPKRCLDCRIGHVIFKSKIK